MVKRTVKTEITRSQIMHHGHKMHVSITWFVKAVPHIHTVHKCAHEKNYTTTIITIAHLLVTEDEGESEGIITGSFKGP